MVDISGFDATKVEPNVGFEPVPLGRYVAAIVKAERKPTKANDGAYLNMQIQILEEGPGKGRVVFDMLHLWNKSQQAVQIAQGTLSAICRAVGVLTPRSTDELLNRPLVIEVGQETYQGNVKNVIKSYHGRDDKPARQTAKDPDANPAPAWMAGGPSAVGQVEEDANRSDDPPF